jgi:hypothetical protein
MLVHYKKLVPGEIQLLPPVKNGKIYKSGIVYTNDSNDLVIQTPSLKMLKTEDNTFNLTFSMIKRGEFLTFLEELEEKIATIIHKKSETFFKGKTFSEIEIRESLVSSFTLSNDGIVSVNGIIPIDNLKILDSFSEEILENDIKETDFYTAILKIDSISFVKSKININISLLRLKKCLEKTRIEDCIFDDEL